MRAQHWLSLATAVTVLCGAATLSSLVAPQVWLSPLVAGLVVTWLIMALLRRRRVGRIWPTAAALAGVVALATAWFAASRALLGFIPTREALAYLYHLYLAGLDRLQAGSPPIEQAPGVALVVVTGLLVAYLLADLTAVVARAPVWALVPALGVWVAPISLGEPVSIVWVAACGVGGIAMLIADTSRRRSGTQSSRSRQGLTLAAATACTVAFALVLAPALLTVPSPFPWRPAGAGDGGTATNLDLGLDLRSDLRRPDPEVVITYEGVQPADLGPLHAYTLTTFNGTSWEHGESEQWDTADGDFLWPGGFDAVSKDSVSITIRNLQQDRLLVPGQPRRVQTEQPLVYSAKTDEVRLENPVSGGFSYGLAIRSRDLSPQRLSGLDPRDVTASPELVQLPDTGFTDRISELTQEVISDAGAQSSYEELIAIQNYLRDPGLFTYTESVDSADSKDAVWDFLQDRRGYCVQFATTMVVMARSLGIPSRLAVGYLPGTANEDGTAQINSDQAHAWPQVLFPEVGWVRFEPTPGVQSGQAPQWAPEASEAADTGPTSPASEPTEATTSPSESAEPTAEPSPSASPIPTSPASAPYWWLLVVAVALLLAVVLLWWRRRRTGAALDATWGRAQDFVRAAGADLGPGHTPRRTVHSASRVFESSASLDALTELARAVELNRYAPGEQAPSAEQLRRWSRRIGADPAVPSVRRWVRWLLG